MEENKMKKHVTAVGIIQIVLGVLGIALTFIVYFAINFGRDFIPESEVPEFVMKLILAFSYAIPIILGFVSVLRLVGGIGLLSCQQWARYMVIVVAVLGCFNVPIGTLLGVYSLWALLQSETLKLFEKK